MFNHEGDEEGIQFWTAALDHGYSKGALMTDMIKAVLYDGDKFKGTDLEAQAIKHKATLENKLKVALYYTKTMGDDSNMRTEGKDNWLNDPAYLESINAVKDVSDNPQSVIDAITYIDSIKTAALAKSANDFDMPVFAIDSSNHDYSQEEISLVGVSGLTATDLVGDFVL